ncbi:MAG: hypothetical protein HFJ91_00820 [Muribaculaceae bacterium]|nr:hypothetical protein [Muribaculaceae bacterium]
MDKKKYIFSLGPFDDTEIPTELHPNATLAERLVDKTENLSRCCMYLLQRVDALEAELAELRKKP